VKVAPPSVDRPKRNWQLPSVRATQSETSMAAFGQNIVLTFDGEAVHEDHLASSPTNPVSPE
jgi:hypothetical protein